MLLDHLELDWPLKGLGICPICECPDETLLAIAEYVENDDLVRMSQVSRKFCSIAQDVLYRNIQLPATENSIQKNRIPKETSAISSLLTTISQRRGLAAKVHSLKMRLIRSCFVAYRLENFGIRAGSDGLPICPWNSTKAYIEECKLAGLLLLRLPELRELDLQFVDVNDCETRDDNVGILRNLSITGFGLPSTAVLAKLERLTLRPSYLRDRAGSIDGPLLELPHLKHVTFMNWRYLDMRPPYDRAPHSSIVSLTLYCSTNIIWDPSPFSNEQISLLRSLPKLRSLTIDVIHEGYTIRSGGWDSAFGLLECTSDKLEELLFRCRVGGLGYWLYTVPPVTSLRNFSKLRTLEIAYDALLGYNYYKGATNHPKHDLEQLLPPQLQQLRILQPHSDIVFWLEVLFAKRDQIPNLTRVDILCPTSRGILNVDLSEIDFLQMMEKTNLEDRLRSVGITVLVSRLHPSQFSQRTPNEHDCSLEYIQKR